MAVAEPEPAGSGRSIWTTRRAISAHIALAILVPGCVVATWWQVGIALGGESIGWVYSVMWPFFAVFGTVFWWNLVHDDPETVGAKGLRRLQDAETERAAHEDEGAAGIAGIAGIAGTSSGPPVAVSAATSTGIHGSSSARTSWSQEMIELAEQEDPELAEYNAYLAALARTKNPKTWTTRSR